MIFFGAGIDFAYTILSILWESQRDPSAGAVIPFLVFVFPIFFIKPLMVILPICIFYKLIYWYKNERN